VEWRSRAPAGYDLEVKVREVVVQSYSAAAPSSRDFHPAVRHAVSSFPVQGFIVGVTDGVGWGWWGPVSREIAKSTRWLVGGTGPRHAASPGRWASRLRRSTRHAHTGILGVACGVLELACWDLLGHRHGVPVWRLLAKTPARARLGSYATCFGMSLNDPDAAAVASRVGEVWQVQKWRPVGRLRRPNHPARLAAAAAGPAGLALDFGGAWSWGETRRLCDALPFLLAWIEEPCPPGELLSLEPGERPAPLAAGEHCYGPDETAILEAADIDIWQPDAVFCGGLSALRGVADSAAAARRRLVPHGGGLVPAIHASVAGATMEMVEYHLLLEPRRQRHLASPVTPDVDGIFGVPELPGWAGPLRMDM
jgi:L-alanine-DL-glutamate epimerase-like enolase superfamily enzyme